MNLHYVSQNKGYSTIECDQQSLGVSEGKEQRSAKILKRIRNDFARFFKCGAKKMDKQKTDNKNSTFYVHLTKVSSFIPDGNFLAKHSHHAKVEAKVSNGMTANSLKRSSDEIGATKQVLLASRVDNSIRFLTSRDIIHPSELGNLILNQDYVLLKHSSSECNLPAIRRTGLCSLKYLAQDKDAPDDVVNRFNTSSKSQYFTNDPNLIYFRLVEYGYSASNNDVVIAAKRDATYVFDQEHRTRSDGSAKSHLGSGISVAEYQALKANQQPGTFFCRGKAFVPWAVHRESMDYIPEVCINAEKIDPEFFVSMPYPQA